jgi:hypothetical protein
MFLALGTFSALIGAYGEKPSSSYHSPGLLLTSGVRTGGEEGKQGCTVIGVGRTASVDGSVMTSHTDCCSECRVQVIPGRSYPKGTLAPVHWGMVYFGRDDDRKALPLGDFGKVIGHIPQVEKTLTYFHTGYSQINSKSGHPFIWQDVYSPPIREGNVSRWAVDFVEKLMTDLTVSRMERIVKLYRELRKKLLSKYTGDIV